MTFEIFSFLNTLLIWALNTYGSKSEAYRPYKTVFNIAMADDTLFTTESQIKKAINIASQHEIIKVYKAPIKTGRYQHTKVNGGKLHAQVKLGKFQYKSICID